MRKQLLVSFTILLGICLWLAATVLPLAAQADAFATPSATATPAVMWQVVSEFGANLLECRRANCATLRFLENNTPLEMLGSEAGWLHVRTADGIEGYIPDFLAVPALPTPTAVPTLTGCTPPAGWVSYTVSVGDTLAGIAMRAGASIDELVTANCLVNRNVINIGQRLLVPRPIAPPSAPAAGQPAPAPGGSPAGPQPANNGNPQTNPGGNGAAIVAPDQITSTPPAITAPDAVPPTPTTSAPPPNGSSIFDGSIIRLTPFQILPPAIFEPLPLDPFPDPNQR
jgi:LysM repeat protein